MFQYNKILNTTEFGGTICRKWYRKNIRFIMFRVLLMIWFIAVYATMALNVLDKYERWSNIFKMCVCRTSSHKVAEIKWKKCHLK